MRWSSAILLATVACTAVTDFDPARWREEGRIACADGVDNDDNGAIDCEESVCEPEANCRCDPADPVSPGCSRGEGCYLGRREAGEFRFCAEAGNGAQGEECASNLECGAGFTCVHRDDRPRCSRTCARVQGSTHCADIAEDAVCAPLGMGYVIDGVEYGVCVDPA